MQDVVLVGISHLIVCPRSTWGVFLIFFLLHRFASPFSRPPSVILWQREQNCQTRTFHLSRHPFKPRREIQLEETIINGKRQFIEVVWGTNQIRWPEQTVIG